jgi:two-component system, OmpR family, sensor kinase
MRLPIRARLTAWHVAVLATILGGLAAFVLVEFRHGLEETLENETRTTMGHLQDEYEAEGPGELVDESVTILGADAFVQLLDDNGRLLVRYSPGRAPDVASTPADARRRALAGGTPAWTTTPVRGGERFRAVAMRVRRAGRDRVLVVGRSLDQIDASVQELVRLLLIAGPAALALAALGAWWLARRALLPVDRMTAQAERIGMRRLNERIPDASARDEVGRLARTLNAMLDRLEEGVDARERLIGDASHELRTPLAVMRAEIDVCLRRVDIDPPARAVLQSAREELDEMSRTVDDLLTLAQIDEGRMRLLLARVDLRQVAEEVVRSLRSLALVRHVRLTVTGDPLVVCADAEQVRHALRNLVENAMKFSPPRGEVRISTWSRRGEGGVTVADDGRGLTDEERERIFDRFARAADGRGRNGGAGLGLAICHEIARAHGGRVWADSAPGEGSAFSLALPAAPARAAEAPAAREQPV